MKHIKPYDDFLNEGKLSFSGMNFSVHAISDNKGLAIQFIPDSKTLQFSKNEQVEAIKIKLSKALPEFVDMFWYEIDNHAAGLVFRLDTYAFAEMITKKLK